MSHGEELGHEYSTSGDVKPRWIERKLNSISVLTAFVMLGLIALCFLCGWIRVVFLLCGLAVALMVIGFLVWWRVESSSHDQRANRTATQNRTLRAQQRYMTIGDDEVVDLAAAWHERDAEEQRQAAAAKATKAAADQAAAEARNQQNDTPTDFRARRQGVRPLISKSEEIQ